jgi:methionine sulfoxide reductase catalytic subunit
MLIRKRQRHALTENDITPEAMFAGRRTLLRGLSLGAVGVGMGAAAPAHAFLDKLFNRGRDAESTAAARRPLEFSNLQTPKPAWEVTPEDKALTYNNFYEFGTQKTDPARNSQHLRIEPWTVRIGGEVRKPTMIDAWELIHGSAIEERIYRFRCVEAWSMVVPWLGIELSTLLRRVEPTSRAKFVAFQTLYDPEQMPGQRSQWVGGGVEFPYVEGLRIDEAMHPLTMLVFGMYGKTLPTQNGAPLRLMSPWKYGFKAIKSIVRIDLVETMPPTTWHRMAPQEYGFYANVNPAVDHPRWSQATERFIGAGTFARRQPTLPFNGYGEDVAGLYAGLDLREWY